MRKQIFGSLLGITMLTTATAGAQTIVPVPADYEPPFYPDGKPLEGLVITVDPGHGGSSFSPGYSGSARGVNSRLVEGDLNMRVAGLVYHHLKDAGARVYLTRRDDRKVVAGDSNRAEELGARPDMADETRSHLFLSLHHNSTGRETADGVVVLIYPTDSEGNEQPLEIAFADILREEVEKQVQHNEPFSHYVIEHPLVVDSDLPSAVVEFGFLSNPEFDAWIDRPTAHKEEAIGVYNAIVRMWSEHGEELEELRSELFPDVAEARDETPTADESLFRPDRRFWQLDRPVETVEEARLVADAVRSRVLTDETTFVAYTDISHDGEEWSVRVKTNFKQIGESVLNQLSRSIGKDIEGTVELYPTDTIGQDPFGVVAAPMALTWARPAEGQSVQTQLLHGEPLFLLDRSEDEQYFLIQGIDGYVGWVRWDAVHRLDREAFTELMTGPTVRTSRNLMDDTYRIPPGSLLVPTEPGTVQRWNPRSETGASQLDLSPENAGIVRDENVGRFVAEMAIREYLYTPYVFGGRSNLGVDCSGLVGSCWAAAGIQLPRDANQQAITGRLVAMPWYTDALMPGDILYFADKTGRTIHTGISLGGSRFIHASPPEVHVNSLDPNDPLYSEGWHEAFFVARRPQG